MNHVDELLDLLEIETGHLKKGLPNEPHRPDPENPAGPVADHDRSLDRVGPVVLGRMT